MVTRYASHAESIRIEDRFLSPRNQNHWSLDIDKKKTD